MIGSCSNDITHIIVELNDHNILCIKIKNAYIIKIGRKSILTVNAAYTKPL